MDDILRVTVLAMDGDSTVVLYEDIVVCAAIVDTTCVGNVKVGDHVDISSECVQNGTPYGIDWRVLYPKGLIIDPIELQNVLYAHGIVTIEDVMMNINTLAQILRDMANKIGATIIKDTKSLGGWK